jgi:hypothetical protein
LILIHTTRNVTISIDQANKLLNENRTEEEYAKCIAAGHDWDAGPLKELIKPIENKENKLEVKDRLTGALSNVRPALIDKADE